MKGRLIYEANGSTQAISYVLGYDQVISQNGNGARALTDVTGTVTDTYDYTAFGELYAQTGTTLNSYLYTGQRFDAATGLYSLRARYYDPVVGHFLSRDTWAVDTWNPVELNRYVYAAANPVTWSDPSGQFMIDYENLQAQMSYGITVVSYYTNPTIGQSLAAFVIGGFEGAIGYCLGLLAYNVPKGRDWKDGWDDKDFIKAIALGGALNVTNGLISDIILKGEENKIGHVVGYGKRGEQKKALLKANAKIGNALPVLGISAALIDLGLSYIIDYAPDHEIDKAVDWKDVLLSAVVTGGTNFLGSNPRIPPTLQVILSVVGNTVATLASKD